jgi:hypothetical protein
MEGEAVSSQSTALSSQLSAVSCQPDFLKSSLIADS